MTRRQFRHGMEFAFFRILSAPLLLLPEGAALRLGGALGWFVGTVLRIRRAAVDQNLRWAFPDETPSWRARVATASYVHLGREAVATFRLARMDAATVVARTPMEGFEAFQAALAEGKGVVLLTGHLGNWEVGGASFAARGVSLDAVTKGMANQRFGDHLSRTRERLGVRVVDMEDAPREMLRSLRQGRVAGLLADQNARTQSLFVPFFGRLAATFRGPALFALRTGAPIFLGVCLREPGWPQRYRVRVRPIRVPLSGEIENDVRRMTEAYTSQLEAEVVRAPEQYFWQHKRWKTRPPEEAVG